MKKQIIKLIGLFFLLLIVVFRLGLWNAGKVGITEDQYWGFLWLQFKWIWGTAGTLILAWGLFCFSIAGVEEIRKRRRERREEVDDEIEMRKYDFFDHHEEVAKDVKLQQFDFADNTAFLKKQPPKAADSDIA